MLCRDKQIGNDDIVLQRKPFSSAAETGVDFVEQEERIVVVHKARNSRRKPVGGMLMPPRT